MDIVKKAEAEVLIKKAEFQYNGKNYKAALKSFLKVLEIELELNEPKEIAKYHSLVGDCYENLEHQKIEERVKDHENAVSHYIKAAEAYSKIKMYEQSGDEYEKAAKCYEELENFDKAANCYIMSAEMFYDAKDGFSASYAYGKAAEYYEQEGDFKSAADSYIKAAKINLDLNDMSSASLNYKKAAKCYERIKDYQNAISYFASSVELDSKLREYLNVANTYEYMAECYRQLNDCHNAIHYHLKSAQLNLENQNYINAGLSYRNVGSCYEEIRDYKNAIGPYLKSAEIYFKYKNYSSAATSYMKVADCYTKINDYENSTKYYIYSAKSSLTVGKLSEASAAYHRAIDVYTKLADDKLKNNLYDEAALAYNGAAECYSEIKDNEKAADFYLMYAEMKFKVNDVAGSKQGYENAAEEYIKADNLRSAAEAYVLADNYEKAADIYFENAKKESDKENYFIAGESFKGASRCYQRLGKDSPRRDSSNKAIWNYLKSVKKKKTGAISDVELKAYGDSYRNAAECYHDIADMVNARKYFEMALEYYEKLKSEDLIILTQAFLFKVDAIIAIDPGYYPKASDLLNKSLSLFDTAISSSIFGREYKKYLQDNKKEVETLLKKIELKPEVTLTLDQRSYTFVNTNLIINSVLTNYGRYTLNNIISLSHLPDELRILKLPETLSHLNSGESKKFAVELISEKAGEYRLKPLEVFYEDEVGNKYVKASNEVLIEVEEKPPSDFRNYTRAIDTYLRYAEIQKGNKNFSYAGDGYKWAAEVYGRFNKDEGVIKYYNNAIECYLKYIELISGKKLTDLVEIKSIGDVNRNIGDCYRDISSMQNAQKFYKNAIEYYKESGSEDMITLTQAFLFKVDGIMAIDHGDYPKAGELLNQSLVFLDKAIKMGGMDSEYMRYLEKNEDDVRLFLEKIKLKPEVTVLVNKPPTAYSNVPFTLNATVFNPGEESIKNIRAIIKIPENFIVSRIPSTIEILRPSGSSTIPFELISKKTGDFTFKPLDITYQDMNGTTYMKGCNEITLNVIESKAVTEKVSEGEKPVLEINFERPEPAKINTVLKLKGYITNISAENILGIRFLGNVPLEFELYDVPEPISKLKPKESINIYLTMKSNSAGDFTFKPLEVFYKDIQGNKFFRSSDAVNIKISGEEPLVGKAIKKEISEPSLSEVYSLLRSEIQYLGDYGVLFLLFKSQINLNVILFLLKVLTERNISGVYICFGRPYTNIMSEMEDNRINTSNVFFIDCISKMSTTIEKKEENVVSVENPSSLEEIGMYVERYLDKLEKKPKFLILDSIQSLLIYNNAKSIQEFSHFLINKIRSKQVLGLIVSLQKEELNDINTTISSLCDKEINI